MGKVRPNIERSGKTALVHYRGGAQGEPLADDYMEGEPLRVRFGMKDVCHAMENALYEMEVGETRHLVIPPEDAFGVHDPDGVQVYPRMQLGPRGYRLCEGDIVTWQNPASRRNIPVRVVETTADYVKMDFNHPLAGKTLEYDLQLVGIE